MRWGVGSGGVKMIRLPYIYPVSKQTGLNNVVPDYLIGGVKLSEWGCL